MTRPLPVAVPTRTRLGAAIAATAAAVLVAGAAVTSAPSYLRGRR